MPELPGETSAGDTSPAPVGRTLAVTRPAIRGMAMASLLGAGAVAASIGLMGTAAWLISRAAQHPSEAALGVAIVGVQFFGLSRGFLRYGERLTGHDAAFRLLADVRVQVYEHLEQLAPSGLSAFRSGDLLARVVQDVDSLQDLVIRVVPPFVIAVVAGTATVAVMWWMLPAAGVILAAALILSATVVPWLTGTLARRREAQFVDRRGDLAESVVDLIEGAPELVAFGAAPSQADTVRSDDAALTAIAARSAGTSGIGLALNTLLAGMACWGCLAAGVGAVASGRLSGTELAVITLVPLAAFELVVGLPVATQALQRARQAAGRVFAVLDAPPPVHEPDAPGRLPDGPYNLEARAVWAGYRGVDASALRGVDLSLPSGRRVAVVGPSGAGKSTLAAVLLRTLPTRAGSVRLNGHLLDNYPGDEVRSVIGLVGQEAYLFDTTIAENLRIGRRSATDEELHGVLDRVGLSPWIADLPAGLATEVGRHGARLSGGQRQRVGLARALLADFPILILDEPTEHLDPLAADALTADLLRATAGRSLILITHRLTGLESVDQILVMDHGEVVEHGGHDELLAAGRRYSDLWWDEMRSERYADSGDVATHLLRLDPAELTTGHDDRSTTTMTTDLARWQFATTSIYHFLFVPVTIGLAFLVALLQTSWYRNDNPVYRRLTRFFGTLLLINVAVGVVTGLVQEFEFGMNWSVYSRVVGNIFGGPLAMEGLLAFFLESTFLGLWIFGWDRLSKKVHLACIWLVAAATMLSAAFIMAANSWMQHPVGYVMNAQHQPVLNNIWALFTNPVFLWGYAARPPGLTGHRSAGDAGRVGLADPA